MARKRQQPGNVGIPGGASGNRTDLAVSAPTGLPYGEAGALQSAQAAVPLATGAPPAPAPTTPPAAGGVPGGSNPPPGGIEAALAAAQGMQPPSGPGLMAPTQRPTEPVTAGLASGPGPGPEALQMPQGPSPGVDVASTLNMLAQASGSPLLAKLATTALTNGG